MTQDQWMILALKIALIAAAAAAGLFTAVYSRLARWWRNPVGRTIVVFDLLVAAGTLPFILSLFFHLSRLNSRVVAWAYVTLWALSAVTLLYRTWLWVRLHRSGRLPRNGNDGLGRTPCSL